MRISKKFLCLILAIAILIYNITMLGNVFAQTADTEPLKIEVTTDKSSYSLLNTAKITVKVTNVSSEAIENVSAEAIFKDLIPVGKDSQITAETNKLEAGQSIEFSYNTMLSPNASGVNFFQKILLTIKRFFAGSISVTDNGFNNSRACIENNTNINFGKVVANNNVKVLYSRKDNSDNLIDTQKELDKITELNNGELPDITFNSDIPSFISGKFSAVEVFDYESAIKSLYDIKKLMKMNEPEKEFIGVSSSETQYKLQQMYNGIPVYGGTLTVTTDGEGNIECLNGHYKPNINIETIPKITEKEAIKIANKNYKAEESKGLIIYAITGYTPTLVYEISCGGFETIFISAEDGHIVSSESDINFIASSGTDLLGNQRSFETHKHSDNLFLLKDVSKGITVYNDYNSTTIEETNNLTYDNILQHSYVEISQENTWNSESVQVMYAIKNAVEFYKAKDTKAFNDSKLSEIIVIINFGQNYYNAFSSTDSNNLSTTYLAIGDGTDYSRAYDVLYHEFTHSIIKATCDLTYMNESGAINEAYADILGNLIENKDDNGCWLVAEDRLIEGTMRSLKSPSDYNQSEKLNDKNMHSYCYENHNHTEAGCDKGGVHINSGIINKVAYLMWENGLSNKGTLADIFVLSLEYMDKDSSFLDCRAAVLHSAKKLGLTKEEINIIKNAFNKVGITSSSSALLSGTVKDSSTDEIIDKLVTIKIINSENIIANHTKADRNGMFSVDIPIGEYTILIECEGYETKAINNFAVTDNTSYDLGTIYLSKCNDSITDEEYGALTDSGICGENAKWNYYAETGTLVIHGSGDMTNYTSGDTIPWYKYKSNINNAIIDNYVISIGASALSLCDNLTNVTIGNNVTSIENQAFFGCSSLTNITIPNSVINIGLRAFANCYSLKSVTIGNSVTNIGDGAFWSCCSLTNITIPDSVTSIEDNVFYDCNNLTNITIPNSVTSIGDNTFDGCKSLVNITIPDSVINIGQGAFRACISLTNITIPNSVISIGDIAFLYCDNLTSVTIGNGVTSIGEEAFADCNNLTNVTMGDNVRNIGNEAFYNCSNLNDLTIPDSAISMGNGAFAYCSNLANITIGNSVTSIGDYAFRSCTNLTNITIPDSVTSIGDGAFYDCCSLTNITVDKNNLFYSSDEYGVLFNIDKTKLIQYPIANTRKTYEIPNGVKYIGDKAFYDCNNLTNITIPNSVISIGSQSFQNCIKIKSITIPSSVTNIDVSAFRNCDNLSDVYYLGTEEQWNKIYKGINHSLINITIHYNS